MEVQPYKRRGGAELQFELCDSSAPLVVASSSRRRGAGGSARPRRSAAAPFASVTMQSGSGSNGAQAVPAFVVASAVESPKLNLEGVPQWRITAGNLAAGATAGCAVEAGERGLSGDGWGAGAAGGSMTAWPCIVALPLLMSVAGSRWRWRAEPRSLAMPAFVLAKSGGPGNGVRCLAAPPCTYSSHPLHSILPCSAVPH